MPTDDPPSPALVPPSSTTPPPQMVTTPSAPFDDPDADTVLRSSDNVDFLVYRLFLSLASPVFKSMFALPQGPAPSAERPVIPLAEDSHTLDLLLRMCYPAEHAAPTTLRDITALLAVAAKYDMPAVRARARRALVAPALLAREPVRVFAIAHRAGLEGEARRAAAATLPRATLGACPAELELVPAAAYHRLLLYHRRCGAAAAATTAALAWVSAQGRGWVWAECRVGAGQCPQRADAADRTVMKAWFVDYMEGAGRVLAERPSAQLVADEKLLSVAINKASRCPFCGPFAYIQLHKFVATDFANEIDRAISKVELELKL